MKPRVLLALLLSAAVLTTTTACQTKMMAPPGTSSFQKRMDWMECENEAEKYGHVDMWGNTGVGAGLEEGMRKNKLMRQCLELKGYTAQR